MEFIPITNPAVLRSPNPETKNIIDTCLKGYYINSKKEKISIKEELDLSLANTKSYPPDYNYAYDNSDFTPGNKQGLISIHNESTVDACYRLVQQENKSNVCALNFGNSIHPGGLFATNARAQEESICRCSSLYYSLIQKHEFYEYNRQNTKGEASNYLIFSPNVPIWKKNDFTLLDKPILASFITSAAVDCLSVRKGINIDETNDSRIQTILKCCIENNVEHIILGAFGCGAFHNNPKKISNCFKKYLVEQNMKSYFETVTFSIYGDQNNLKVFRDTFRDKPC
ncbi:TIGR02452 family protein [Histomonas meleagridis]|uniref:TIGR02452 family protein n=1 Tax=Histomonas meleagridis TaxID=135588 RepID=UPI003559B8D4|nr:TIGR02452 family protein [Histomonas meleagridis]KAH0806755.1 TIGR02452 family protein [Histomonas meleagridis]